MKKKDREIVFNKFGGRCAYCGEPLRNGWHVDELLPCRRKYKRVPSHYILKSTGEKADVRHLTEDEFTKDKFEYIPEKMVSDGYSHPERLHIDNQMPACASCNINKHSMSLEEFRKLIEGFIYHLNNLSTQYKIAKRYGLIQETIKPIVFYFEGVGCSRILNEGKATNE